MPEPEGTGQRWSCGCLIDVERNVVVLGCNLNSGHVTGAEWRFDRLVAFMYLLMRDHLPVGTVTSMVNELRTASQFALTTEPLAELAKLRAAELRA